MVVETKATIIVPAFNEQERLTDCLLALKDKLGADFEVIVACSGCTDNTEFIARAMADNVYAMKERLGKGLDLLHASLMATTEKIVFYDADQCVDPFELPHMAGILDYADIVIGKRNKHGLPFIRNVASIAYRGLANRMLDMNFYDTQCGCKAFRRNVLINIGCDLQCSGYGFDAELLTKAVHRKYKIVEYPVEWKYDSGSKVHVASDGWKMLKDLWKARSLLKS